MNSIVVEVRGIVAYVVDKEEDTIVVGRFDTEASSDP